jgi:hypothetical protein
MIAVLIRPVAPHTRHVCTRRAPVSIVTRCAPAHGVPGTSTRDGSRVREIAAPALDIGPLALELRAHAALEFG